MVEPMTASRRSLLRAVPKIELHVHFDGALCNALLFAHLRSPTPPVLPAISTLPSTGAPLRVRAELSKCADLAAFDALCTCRDQRSLDAMLACFEYFTPILRGNARLLEQNAFQFVERQARNHVVYTELRYSPHFLAAERDGSDGDGRVPDARPVVEAVTRGLERGCARHGIVVKQILCCLCFKPEWSASVVELCEEFRDGSTSSGGHACGVVGVDIAAGEQHFDEVHFPLLHGPHLAAMKRAKDLHIPITIHAGENTDDTNVRKAVDEYGAVRIGHGYRVVGGELMPGLKRRNIHFECCPTSSYETGGWDDDLADWSTHPMKRMLLDHDLAVSISSDDPTVFDTDISEEYAIVHEKMGIALDRIKKTNLGAIDAAFCDEETKRKLRGVVEGFDYNTGKSSAQTSRLVV